MNTHSPFEPGYIGNSDSDVAPARLERTVTLDVPTGTVDEIVGWVDGDPDRARAAHDAEQEKGKRARKTLLARLDELLAEPANA